LENSSITDEFTVGPLPESRVLREKPVAVETHKFDWYFERVMKIMLVVFLVFFVLAMTWPVILVMFVLGVAGAGISFIWMFIYERMENNE